MSKSQSKTTRLRNVLQRMGRSYDTEQTYQELRYFFRPRDTDDGGKYLGGQVFGKDFKNLQALPDDPRTETLVRNLLFLRSLFQPKDALKLIGHDIGKEELDRTFDEALGVARVRHKACSVLLSHAQALRARLGSEEFSILNGLLEKLPGEDTPPHPAAAQGTDAIAALFNLRMLDEAEASQSGDTDPPDARAERAVRLCELGCYREAHAIVRQILDQQPGHGIASYAGALILLAEASKRSEASATAAFVAELTSDANGLVSDAMAGEAHQHAGEALLHREQALPLLVQALTHWPCHEGYYDHSQLRRNAMWIALQLAFQRSEHRDRAEGVGHLGATLTDGDAKASALDAALLELLHKEEAHRHALADPGEHLGAMLDLVWAQLYWVLAPDDYARFAPQWLKRLPGYPAPALEKVCLQPALRRHLNAIIPSVTDRVALLRRLEARCHQAVTWAWNQPVVAALRDEMVRLYGEGKLEEALDLASQAVALGPGDDERPIYWQVRILYDLACRDREAGRASSAAGRLRQILHDYPALVRRLRNHHPHYLNEIDADYNEYRDDFGGQDVLFRFAEDGQITEQGAPLRILFDELVTDERLSVGERQELLALRPSVA